MTVPNEVGGRIIPAGGGVVRHMMVTRDGNLALAESGINRVALVTIEK